MTFEDLASVNKKIHCPLGWSAMLSGREVPIISGEEEIVD
jgi:hypothetical protein